MMGFLRDVARAKLYRKKDAVTPEEFIEALQSDFGRDLDLESVFFFRHHPITVNLVNKILLGRLTQTGDKEKDDLVAQALIAEIAEYIPSLGKLSLASPTIIADLVEEFSKTYKDAGNIIGQAMVIFLKLKK